MSGLRGPFKGFFRRHLPPTLTLLGISRLAACDGPAAVVAVPAASVAVPAPAAPPDVAGVQGIDGMKGETGKPSESTAVIVTPSSKPPSEVKRSGLCGCLTIPFC